MLSLDPTLVVQRSSRIGDGDKRVQKIEGMAVTAVLSHEPEDFVPHHPTFKNSAHLNEETPRNTEWQRKIADHVAKWKKDHGMRLLRHENGTSLIANTSMK